MDNPGEPVYRLGFHLDVDVRISMHGRGRFLNNIFVERLWHSVKYENVYPKAYNRVPPLAAGTDYFPYTIGHWRPKMACAAR